MKRIFVVMMLGLIATGGAAQTRVEKKVATRGSGYGVTYSLPKTSLVVHVEIRKVICKAGAYCKYAAKYLGVKDIVTADEVCYELGEITLSNKGIPDENSVYVVEFKPGTVAPYVYLTEDGLLCTVNAEYEPPVSASDPAEKTEQGGGARPTDVVPVLTEELLMAGSVMRQAEVAARQIYHIRERRMDILTGDVDNQPPDGEAMKLMIKQLEDQEKALTNLFTGTRNTEIVSYDVTIVPQEDLENEVLFRFSKKLGLLDADDLGGSPVYMNLKSIGRAPELSPKEAEKKEKAMKGLIYNVPGKARVEIRTAQEILHRAEVQVVQFGTRESLAPVLFENKKNPVKIFFYPETGAIRQIIQ